MQKIVQTGEMLDHVDPLGAPSARNSPSRFGPWLVACHGFLLTTWFIETMNSRCPMLQGEQKSVFNEKVV